jgi:hypothetical protein
MKKKNTEVPGEPLNSYIQPSHNLSGQPAQVAQVGWIAYFNLPSSKHSHPSIEHGGRGFLKGKFMV